MQRVSGYAQQGNVTVNVAGVASTTLVQGSYPGCTVSVFNQGTLVLATIYSDNNLTIKSNPFLSSATDGSFFFYSANGRYDIQFSGLGIAVPFTIGDVLLFDPTNPTFTGSTTITGNLTVNGNATVGGALTAPSIGTVLYVGPGGYATCQAAVTAAGTTVPTKIIIENSYAGAACPGGLFSSNPNIWFEVQNQTDPLNGSPSSGGTWNRFDGNVLSLETSLFTRNAFGGTTAGEGLVNRWFVMNVDGLTVGTATGSTIDGIEATVSFFNTLTGTIANVNAAEHVVLNLGTGGAITNAQAVLAELQTGAGATPINTWRGFWGNGCNVSCLTKPTNFYNIYGSDASGLGATRSYAAGFEGPSLLLYSGTSNSAGFDMETAAHVAAPLLKNNGSNTILSSVQGNFLLNDTGANTRANFGATGFRVGDNANATATLDVNGSFKVGGGNTSFFVEGACGTGNAAIDQMCANSTDHALTLSNNGGAYGHVLATGSTDSKGLQTKRGVAGCTTGGAAGNSCASDITVTWATAFADANYAVTCTGSTPTNVPSAPFVVSGTKLAATVHINYFAITAAAASYATIDCIAVHD